MLAATVGSAVGLGNIWRFPYEAGMHGGSAFLIIYILFVLVLGIPAICAEFVLGRATRQNAAGAFRRLGGGKFWPYVGIMGILCSFLILGFYTVSPVGRLNTSSPPPSANSTAPTPPRSILASTN